MNTAHTSNIALQISKFCIDRFILLTFRRHKVCKSNNLYLQTNFVSLFVNLKNTCVKTIFDVCKNPFLNFIGMTKFTISFSLYQFKKLIFS